MGRVARSGKSVSDVNRTILDAMNEQNEKQLEQLIHRELRKLPELSAPETLVHRVMLAVHVKERQPWWQRPWLTWPRPVQLGSAALFAATVTALVYFGAQAWQATGIVNPLDKIWQWVGSLSPLWDRLVTIGNAVVSVVQKGGRQYLLIGSGIAVTMYLFCVAAGTAFYRLAFNRR
jgi:hypothetical protein